ncbi:MAG: tetratricopeptide repeat protein [Clostridia bacterium]|nr:tetratricopeptide repeat protein [Clostridia bacterium]
MSETGQSVPDITVLTSLADYFEVSLDALVGYTVQARRQEDLVSHIRLLARQKKYTEAIHAAQEALRRYPNHFSVVYESARLYGLSGMERSHPDELRMAISLMQRAMSLMEQNANPALRMETLWSCMGLYHANLGEREQAIRCYEAGNFAGVNDIAIANSHAALGRYEQALPTLTHGLVSSLTRVYNAGIGALRCLLALGELTEAEVLSEWLLHVLDGMDATPGSYVLKLQAMVHGWSAAVNLRLGRQEDAGSHIRHAADCAARFDAAPDHSLRSIRFYRGEEKALSDGLGETAMDALRRIIDQNSEVSQSLTHMLSTHE